MKRKIRRRAGPAGAVVLGLLAGCYADKGEVNIPPPTGTHTRRILDQQVAKAQADRFVIYKYEWLLGKPVLGPFGEEHVHRLAGLLMKAPFPVLIQADHDAALNQARVETVALCLAQQGIVDADQRVVVGLPEAEGLYLECEGERTFLQMLHAQSLYGVPGTGFGYGGLAGYGGGYGFGGNFNSFAGFGFSRFRGF